MGDTISPTSGSRPRRHAQAYSHLDNSTLHLCVWFSLTLLLKFYFILFYNLLFLQKGYLATEAPTSEHNLVLVNPGRYYRLTEQDQLLFVGRQQRDEVCVYVHEPKSEKLKSVTPILGQTHTLPSMLPEHTSKAAKEVHRGAPVHAISSVSNVRVSVAPYELGGVNADEISVGPATPRPSLDTETHAV